jgi:hypothetical protein
LDAAPEALVGEDILEELPSSDPRGRSAGLVRDLFAAADAWQFRQRRPAPELLQAHAEIEALLEVMRRRL